MAEAADGTRERPRVFISAKSSDYEYARRVHAFLTSAGVPTFFSEQSLPSLGSSDYRREIDRALDESDHMVVVTSAADNVQASWVEAEWGFFINEKRSGRKHGNLVTVVVGGLRPTDLPPSLRYYEVIGFDDAGLERLLGYVREAAAGPQPRYRSTAAASEPRSSFRELATFGAPPRVHLLSLRPGTSVVATGSFDGAVRLYDVETRTRRAVIGSQRYWMMGAEGLITALEFSSDGQRLASGHLDGSVHAWDVDSKEELGGEMRHEQAVSGLVFSRDGSVLISAGKEGVLNAWDLKERKPRPAPFSVARKPAPAVSCLRVPGRDWLLTGLVDTAARRYVIQIQDAAAAANTAGAPARLGQVLATIAVADSFTILRLSDDGSLLFAGNANGWVKVYDFALALEALSRGESPKSLTAIRDWAAHKKPIKSLTLFPDGRRLVTCAMDSYVIVWDIESGKPLIRLQGAADETFASSVVLRDGTGLVGALADGRVRLWDAV